MESTDPMPTARGFNISPMRAARIKPSLTSLIALGLFLLPFIYVLSYAPVVRISGRSPLDDDLSVYYRGVDWLLDRTRRYEPHLKWAGLWGVEEEFNAPLLWVYKVESADQHEIARSLAAEIPSVVINEEGRNDMIHIYATPLEHRQVRAFIEREEVLAETAGSK